MNTLMTVETIPCPVLRGDRTTALVNQENARTLIQEALARSHRAHGLRAAAG